MNTPDTRTMADRWESFARENAMHYVATGRKQWNRREFYDSGQAVARRLNRWIGPEHPRGRVLEIGCGMCRTLIHMAGHFDHAVGIDIAPSMIEQARQADLPDNITLHVGDGARLDPIGDASIDFVYSVLVMQHIPDLEILASYLVEIRRVLAPHGKAAVQFDTRRRTLVSALQDLWPQPLRPRLQREFIRRYRVDARVLRDRIHAAGLEIIEEARPDTMAHFFLMRPDAAAGAPEEHAEP